MKRDVLTLPSDMEQPSVSAAALRGCERPLGADIPALPRGF